MAVGTYQGVAGLAPRLFTLEEETGSHHGHGHVHRTRMLICMHNWGSSLHLPPHRRPSIIVVGARGGGDAGYPAQLSPCTGRSPVASPPLSAREFSTTSHLSACPLSSLPRAVCVRRRHLPPRRLAPPPRLARLLSAPPLPLLGPALAVVAVARAARVARRQTGRRRLAGARVAAPCRAADFAVYAVYAISSLDTG